MRTTTILRKNASCATALTFIKTLVFTSALNVRRRMRYVLRTFHFCTYFIIRILDFQCGLTYFLLQNIRDVVHEARYDPSTRIRKTKIQRDRSEKSGTPISSFRVSSTENNKRHENCKVE